MPADVVFTSLAYDDALSYREHAAGSLDEAAARAREELWAPDGGRVPQNYRAAACFGLDVAATAAALGGAGAPMAGIVDQARARRRRGESERASARARFLAPLSALRTFARSRVRARARARA